MWLRYVLNMSKPVFGDKIMSKTLSKSQIISHNHVKVILLNKIEQEKYDLKMIKIYNYLTYSYNSILYSKSLVYFKLILD